MVTPQLTLPDIAHLWPQWSSHSLLYIYTQLQPHQLQDKWIKADCNFFLMWAQWVPPKLGPTQSIPQENLPAGFKYSTFPEHSLLTHTCNNHMKKSTPSTMPVSKASATAIAKKHFSREVFYMCWSTEAEPVPLVEILTASSLAKPPYGSQSISIYCSCHGPHLRCAGTLNAIQPPQSMHQSMHQPKHHQQNETLVVKVVLVPAITVEAAMPLAAAPYDFCWDEAPQSTMANSSHIPTPSAAGISAAEHQGQDGDNEGHLTAEPTTGSVNSAADNQESSESQDTQVSLTPSSAPTKGLAMVKLEAGEELLLQVDERLQRLDMMMSKFVVFLAVAVIMLTAIVKETTQAWLPQDLSKPTRA
ncbi:hypothetical protein BDR04DRAFT_1121323 [Suillus decipiens]|nr:hypothetical protein BDR04DRAFT_1121323 [Suillus decipiens]